MDCEQQELKLLHSDHEGEQYLWIDKNHYHKLYSGFVHDQHAKVRLQMKKDTAVFKIEQKLLKNGKTFELNNTFWTWNLLSPQTPSPLNAPQSENSLIKKLAQEPLLVFGAGPQTIKLEWRLGHRAYKNFQYNPFIILQTPKNLSDLNLSLGLIHASTHLNLSTKFSASVVNPTDFIHKAKLEYAKNQMFMGVVAQLSQGLSCKINKSVLGYELSPGNNFYLRFQTENIGHLVKGKPTYQQIGIYYLKQVNENLKFGLGVKSINSIENYLNLTVQSKSPYHVKGKIDSKLNICLTVRKQINDALSFAYGVGVSNLFQKRSRIQTGIVFQYNA